MRKSLIKQLRLMDTAEYLELHHSLCYASKIRVLLRTYNKDSEWYMTKLGVTKAAFMDLINGCYPLDISLISKMCVIELELELESCRNSHEDYLQLPDYTYSKKIINEPGKSE